MSFTKNTFAAPLPLSLTGDYKRDVLTLIEDRRQIMVALTEWFQRLEDRDALQIARASIDDSAIGATSPSTGKFTTLETTGKAGIGQAPGTAQLEVNGVIRSVADNGGYFTKEGTATAGGNVTITNATRGLAIVCNQTSGNTSMLSFDAATGLTVFGETSAGKLVTADPGAGTSKVWVSFGGGGGLDLVFTNRWASSQVLHIIVLGAANLPS